MLQITNCAYLDHFNVLVSVKKIIKFNRKLIISIHTVVYYFDISKNQRFLSKNLDINVIWLQGGQ